MRGVFVCLLVLLLVPGCSRPEPEPQDSGATLDVAGSPESAFRLPPQPTPPPTGQRNRPISSVDPAELARVHGLTASFYAGDVEAVFESFSDEMKQTLGLGQLEELQARVSETYGKESAVIAERAAINGDIRAFVRWARFDKTDAVIQVEWYLRPDDSVAGFFIEPARRQGETGQ